MVNVENKIDHGNALANAHVHTHGCHIFGNNWHLAKHSGSTSHIWCPSLTHMAFRPHTINDTLHRASALQRDGCCECFLPREFPTHPNYDLGHFGDHGMSDSCWLNLRNNAWEWECAHYNDGDLCCMDIGHWTGWLSLWLSGPPLHGLPTHEYIGSRKSSGPPVKKPVLQQFHPIYKKMAIQSFC